MQLTLTTKVIAEQIQRIMSKENQELVEIIKLFY